MTYECIESCADSRQNCLNSCGHDTICGYDCDYLAASCTNSCPCFENCPSGCENCPSSFCACQDVANSPDFISCKEKIEQEYSACILACEAGDFLCLAMCSRQLDEDMIQCPCQEGCPNGCPCQNYECETETTTEVLSTASEVWLASIACA